MIVVECPHCGEKHILLPDEIDILFRSGKFVVTNCQCDKLYTVEQDDDCYFTH